jgi:hypothetical protein
VRETFRAAKSNPLRFAATGFIVFNMLRRENGVKNFIA